MNDLTNQNEGRALAARHYTEVAAHAETARKLREAECHLARLTLDLRERDAQITAVGADVPADMPSPIWWVDHGSYGQITQRREEADKARAAGASVHQYHAAPQSAIVPAVSAEPLEVTLRPLIRNAIELLRMRLPVTPDVDRVISDLELILDGRPAPADAPRSNWLAAADHFRGATKMVFSPVAAQPQAPGMRPANPAALDLTIAELDELMNGDCCDPLTPSQGESVMLVLHELKRLRATQSRVQAQQPCTAAWTSLNDRLPDPEEHQRVLIYTEGVDFHGEQFFDVKASDLHVDDPDQHEVCEHATHWMPLPAPRIAQQPASATAADGSGLRAFLDAAARDGVTHLKLPTSATDVPKGEPVFWYRPRSDGGYEGPLHNSTIEEVRKRSGAWIPLYFAQPDTSSVRDAARYRWLRQHWGRTVDVYDGDTPRMTRIEVDATGDGWDVDPETLDAAIDVAMKEKP